MCQARRERFVARAAFISHARHGSSTIAPQPAQRWIGLPRVVPATPGGAVIFRELGRGSGQGVGRDEGSGTIGNSASATLASSFGGEISRVGLAGKSFAGGAGAAEILGRGFRRRRPPVEETRVELRTREGAALEELAERITPAIF